VKKYKPLIIEKIRIAKISKFIDLRNNILLIISLRQGICIKKINNDIIQG